MAVAHLAHEKQMNPTLRAQAFATYGLLALDYFTHSTYIPCKALIGASVFTNKHYWCTC